MESCLKAAAEAAEAAKEAGEGVAQEVAVEVAVEVVAEVAEEEEYHRMDEEDVHGHSFTTLMVIERAVIGVL